MNPTLLVELLTEELPPKALQALGQAFSTLLHDALAQAGLTEAQSTVTTLATPRRLGCLITHVTAQAADTEVLERLLPVKIGLDSQGQPTPPLIKKLGSLGLEQIDPQTLEITNDGKQDVLNVRRTVKGQSLPHALTQALELATSKLPIPKVMSYQRPNGDTIHFVRPAHRLIALHGPDVISTSVLGLQADRITLGHRFLSKAPIAIRNADSYVEQLRHEGKVIASFEARRQYIVEQLNKACGSHQVIQPDSLIDEVCALVEWPVVYEGQFDEAFLEVPQECLILTMQANQKYFAMTDANGRMVNRFLLVSNLETATPEFIVHGNERVLRARLADARFFFNQDKKRSLESRVDQLDQVVYHNKLGTQKDRNNRLVALAGWLSTTTQAPKAQAERAALLCKTDLLTDMVGEFPELQGNMGEHYALHDGETLETAQAIADHYSPRFAGDALPRNSTGLTLALADKLETLCGIFGIGLIPTGDKDPFALRRHALGIVRMVIEKNLPLNIRDALHYTASLFGNHPDFKNASDAIYSFMLDRLRSYLKDAGYNTREIESVLSHQPTRFDDLTQRLQAVRSFTALEACEALAAANKRIHNILKKVDTQPSSFNEQLLQDDAEKALAAKVKTIAPEAVAAFDAGNYELSLQLLAPLRHEVDAFFEHVMVMSPDESLRNNRIALLAWLHGLMNRVADISQLAS